MNTKQLSPRESAQHMATALREDIGAIPTFATPKYPVPAIMQTEKQIAIMMAFAQEGNCDEKCLGITEGDISEMLAKARILRAKVLIRKIKKGEGSCADARTVSDLVADGFVMFSDIHMEEEAFFALMRSCSMPSAN